MRSRTEPLAWGFAVCVGASAACTVAFPMDGYSNDTVRPDAGVVDGGTPEPDAGDPRDASAEAEAGIADPDLVAAWSFDSVTGSVVPDLSGNGHDATLVGTTVADGGVRGAAVELGPGRSVRVGSLDGEAFPRSGSLSFWIAYGQAPANETGQHIFDKWDPLRAHLYISRTLDKATPLYVAFQQPSDAGPQAFTTYAPTESSWTHVVVTWDAVKKEGQVFSGKKLVRAAPYDADNASFVPSAQLFVFGGTQFIGRLDEVSVYKRALSAAEVASLP